MEKTIEKITAKLSKTPIDGSKEIYITLSEDYYADVIRYANELRSIDDKLNEKSTVAKVNISGHSCIVVNRAKETFMEIHGLEESTAV